MFVCYTYVIFLTYFIQKKSVAKLTSNPFQASAIIFSAALRLMLQPISNISLHNISQAQFLVPSRENWIYAKEGRKLYERVNVMPWLVVRVRDSKVSVMAVLRPSRRDSPGLITGRWPKTVLWKCPPVIFITRYPFLAAPHAWNSVFSNPDWNSLSRSQSNRSTYLLSRKFVKAIYLSIVFAIILVPKVDDGQVMS